MKKFLPFLICFTLLLTISFSSTAFAATAYEAESNDTIASANKISPGDTSYGKISSASDTDYFKLQVSASVSTDILLSNIPSGCDYDLYLYDSNGNSLGSSGLSGNSDDKISQILNGTYYIKVKSFKGFSGSYYKLSVSGSNTTPTNPPSTPVHGGDAYEYNDSIDLASSMYGYVEANIHPLGDIDYYRFSVTETTKKHIVLYNPDVDLRYHFNIYNANGDYVAWDGSIGDCTVTLSPGTYYIEVFSYNSESVLDYRLIMNTVN